MYTSRVYAGVSISGTAYRRDRMHSCCDVLFLLSETRRNKNGQKKKLSYKTGHQHGADADDADDHDTADGIRRKQCPVCKMGGVLNSPQL